MDPKLTFDYALRFASMNSDQLGLFPREVREYVLDDHDASFIVDLVAKSDLRPFQSAYADRGSVVCLPSTNEAGATVVRLYEEPFVESQSCVCRPGQPLFSVCL